MLVKSLLLFVLGGANFAIAALVLARDSSKLQNRLFFIFSIAIGAWAIGIGGFLQANAPISALWWAKLYYAFPLLVAATMPLFSYSFPSNQRPPRALWVSIVTTGLVLLACLLLIPHFITTEVVYHAWGKEIVLNKLDYLAYSTYLLICFFTGFLHTFYKMRASRGNLHTQLTFYFYGFLLTSTFGVFFNLFLPWFGNYHLIWLGPIFTCNLVAAIGYAVIRHRMFDVRLVVARSVAYLLTLLAVAVLYGFVIFGLSRYVLDIRLSAGVQALLSLSTGVAALAFPRIKRTFDKTTNRLFYRDAYEPQYFLDQFNRTLVAHIDLEPMLKDVADIIQTNLKVESCIFWLSNGERPQLLVGGVQERFSAEDKRTAQKLLKHISDKIIIADSTYLLPDQDKLTAIMVKNNVGLLARLIADGQAANKKLMGYMLLGNKKSGNPLTETDIHVIQIIVNELVIAIENALRFEEIENFNATLQERIEEATRKLRRTNEKLRTLDETKDDFISMASHQLRTPLTSVKGYVSMVLDGDAGTVTPLQRKLLNQSFISSQRMVYLISDLLNVSRLRTGKFIIEPVRCNLAAIVKEEVDQLVETAKGRSLTLSFTKPERFPDVLLDETKTRQVIMNFIDNAIYYTPAGGHIVVALTNTADSISFTVTDNGIGIPKSEQHHLFGKFYRAPNAKRARPDGTGLGLFMAKKVIIAQGGAVTFTSKEGEGSTFGFTFRKEGIMVDALKERIVH